MLTCVRCGKPERRRQRRICNECYAVQNRALVKKNSERPEVKARIKLHNADYITDPRRRLRVLMASARHSAKKRGLTYSLTEEWAAGQKLERCVATGIEFDLNPPREGWIKNPEAPSLDRRDNSKGYTPENVQIVCWAYNVAKHEFSEDVLLRLARAIVDRNPETGV